MNLLLTVSFTDVVEKERYLTFLAVLQNMLKDFLLLGVFAFYNKNTESSGIEFPLVLFRNTFNKRPLKPSYRRHTEHIT